MDSALHAPLESNLWTLAEDNLTRKGDHRCKDSLKSDEASITGETAGCLDSGDMRYNDPLSEQGASDTTANKEFISEQVEGASPVSSNENEMQSVLKKVDLDHDQIELSQKPRRPLMGWFQNMRSGMTNIGNLKLAKIKTFCSEQLGKLVKNGSFLAKYILNRSAQFKESEIQEILKPQPISSNQESVDLGIGTVSTAAKSTIEQCKKISTLINHALDLQKIAENKTASNEDKKAAKLTCVKSLLEVINSGSDNEGIRCFKLLIALADDREKLLNHYRAIEENEENEELTFSLERNIVAYLKQYVFGDHRPHLQPASAMQSEIESLVVPLLDALKSMKSFNSLVITMNHYSNDELKEVFQERLGSYIRQQGGGWFHPVNNSIDRFIDALCTDAEKIGHYDAAIKEEPPTLLQTVYEGLVRGYGQHEPTELQKFAQLDVTQRQEDLYSRLNDTMLFLNQISGTIYRFVTQNDSFDDRKESVLKLNELLTQKSHQKVFNFLIEVVSEKLDALVENPSREDTVFDEICELVPDFYKPALKMWINEFAEQSGGVATLVNGLFKRLNHHHLVLIINHLTMQPYSEDTIRAPKSSGEVSLELLSRVLLDQPSETLINIARSSVRHQEALDKDEKGDFCISVDRLAAMGYRLLDAFEKDHNQATETHELKIKQSELGNLLRGLVDSEVQEELVALIRNIGSLPNFDTAFHALKESVPPFLQHNFEKLKGDYRLSELIAITKNIVPLMSSSGILDYLKMIPDAGVEAVRVTIRDVLNHVGKKNNNLNTALQERSSESHQSIRNALLSRDGVFTELASLAKLITDPVSEERFIKWAYANNVTNGFTDNHYSHIPDRQRIPLLAERRALIVSINRFKQLIESYRLQMPEEHLSGIVRRDDLTIDRLLGLTAQALLRINHTDGDSQTDARDVVKIVKTVQDQQVKVIGHLVKLMGDMGVYLDFRKLMLTDSNNQQNIHSTSRAPSLQDQLVELRSLLARYCLSHGIQNACVNAIPPYHTATAYQGESITPLEHQDTVINVSDRLKAAKYSLGTLSTLQSLDRPIVSDQEQIKGLWDFTCEVLEATDVTQVYECMPGSGTLLRDSDGEPSLVIINVDGSVVDENGVTHYNGSVRASHYKQILNYEEDLEHATIEARTEIRQRIFDHFDLFISMLATHNTADSLNQFLDQALLPPSVQNMLASMISDVLPIDVIGSTIGGEVLRSLLDYPDTLKMKFVRAVPDFALDSIMSQFTQIVNVVDPFEEMPFFKKFGKVLVASLTEVKTIQEVAGQLTKEYYKVMPHCDKRRLASAVLAVGRPQLDQKNNITLASLTQMVGAMTQAAGPGYQKAIQLFKGAIMVPWIRQALDETDSDVSPMPIDYVIAQIQKRIEAICDDSGHSYRLLTSEELSSNNIVDQYAMLGSATIAQAHVIHAHRLGTNNEPIGDPIKVAAKLRRPHIKHRVAREMSALRSITDLTRSAQGTLAGLDNSILKETNFNQEFDFSEIMQALYQRTDETGEEIALRSANMVGLNENLLLQNFASGEKPTSIWNQLNLKEANSEQSIREKIQFLGALSDRLYLLVSQFAMSAFLGDVQGKVTTEIIMAKEEVLELSGNNTLLTTPKNSVVIYPVRGSNGHEHNGYCDYIVQFFDKKGVLKQEISNFEASSHLLPLFNKLRINGLSLQERGELCDHLRTVLQKGLLFEGESFIDSDRHDGNVLYVRGDTSSIRSEAKTAKLTCIDTGAGMIVNEFERIGMIRIGVGIVTGDVQTVMEGIKHLIPDIDQPERYKEKPFTKSGLNFSYGSLVDEIDRSINMKSVAQEKKDDIYSFLLSHGVVDFELSQEVLFADLENIDYPEIKKQILDFEKPEMVVNALLSYLQERASENEALGVNIDLDAAENLRVEMADKIHSANYHRAVNYNATLTDGDNTLLLIKSLRRLANILNEFDLHAPEAIVQLNRGAKFVEDQVKRVNLWKQEVKTSIDSVNEKAHKQVIVLSPEERYALRSLDIGDAYRDGLADGSSQILRIFQDIWQNTNKVRVAKTIPSSALKVTSDAARYMRSITAHQFMLARDKGHEILSNISEGVNSVVDFATRIGHQRHDGLIREALHVTGLTSAEADLTQVDVSTSDY